MRIVIIGGFALACASVPAAAQKPVPASERVKACDRQIALTAAEEIIKSPDSLKQPLLLHSAAAVLFDQGRKDEAVFWSWVPQLQSWYAFVGPTGFAGLTVDQLLANLRRPTAGWITNYALQDTRRFEQILVRVQERDRDRLNPALEKREQVYRRLDELREKIAAQRADIEERARAIATEVDKDRASARRSMCLEVLIHPADAPRLIAAEQALVLEFVRNQPDVISAVSVVRDVSPDSYTVQQNHLLPSKYEVTVRGAKVMFAIVEVSRGASEAKFKLVCVVSKSSWHRDAHKDPCKQ